MLYIHSVANFYVFQPPTPIHSLVFCKIADFHAIHCWDSYLSSINLKYYWWYLKITTKFACFHHIRSFHALLLLMFSCIFLKENYDRYVCMWEVGNFSFFKWKTEEKHISISWHQFIKTWKQRNFLINLNTIFILFSLRMMKIFWFFWYWNWSEKIRSMIFHTRNK